MVTAGLVLAPTDLGSFLSCRHRIALDLAAALGLLARPAWTDPVGPAMRARGLEHEKRYVEWLRSRGETRGHTVADLSDVLDEDLDAATREAMAHGAAVIVQGSLRGPGWRGTADVLVRVDRTGALSPWSYEVHDTKLAGETRGGAILQLSAYSDLLSGIQGIAPERMHVVTPGGDAASGGFRVESHRVDEYAAYYRRVVAQLLAAVAEGCEAMLEQSYPEPVEACELCRWWLRCEARRRADDHLSYIAGIGRWHRTELTAQGHGTLALTASMPVPIAFTPSRGAPETYARLREQARLQHQQRSSLLPVYEPLPVQRGQGLCRLPPPSPGDLFLDLEGARFAREGGREYLFGIRNGGGPPPRCDQASATRDPVGGEAEGYSVWWAHDDAEERAAFEAVMDLIEAQWTRHPDMHVYHFAPYEPSAFKRLTGRYATRADLLDRLLRGERFVDLLAVVRQSLRAGVESYSIKQLERFYGFERTVPLGDAAAHMQAIEMALEGLAPAAILAETRAAVEGYNQDDCRSTAALRDWLEHLRAQAIAGGVEIPRPTPKDDSAPERVGELEAQQQAARARLLDGLGTDAATPGHADHPRWLLAYLLDWHRREDKAQFWERYRLDDLSEEELVDERQAIAGLELVDREVTPGRRGSTRTVDRYRYPPQDTEVRAKGELLIQGGPRRIGDIDAHDRAGRVIAIRKAAAYVDVHPSAVFQATVVVTDAQQRSLLRLCERVGADTAGMDLLHRRPPRLRTGTLEAHPGESLVDRARRLAVSLDRTTLAVQGPPGAGKTYLGAQMIRALVSVGRRVGVVAQSHKVIVNLLDAVTHQARERNETVRVGRKVGSDEDAPVEPDGDAIRGFDDNDEARDALRDRQVDVFGGTAWMWAREAFADAVDVLVVDEAGQFSLANALAVSSACDSLVLLGDPQQLTQPQKGSHPDGVDVSALRHVLGDHATMPVDRGLFLPTTWRMAPAICAFTSEQFYDGKLTARDGLERQRLSGTQGLDGSGLGWCPVPHAGNRHWSAEEIDMVDDLVTRLLAPGAQWVDGDCTPHPLGGGDILVMAPYNAQVYRLADRLATRGVRVGTVDKFQGQEAAVAIYAMGASSAADAPRGMEFLHSRNRLNVATSRARCAAIVVASPALLEPECRTPRQIRLANALCRFVELARSTER